MIRAGIKELKNNLSRYLSSVKMGEEILVTERGRPVARIVKEEYRVRSIRSALAPLVQTGLVSLPTRSIGRDRLSPLKTPGKPVSEMVIEDRR